MKQLICSTTYVEDALENIPGNSNKALISEQLVIRQNEFD